MVAADEVKISVGSFVETSIVVEAQTKGAGASKLDALLRTLAVAIEPITEEQARIARQAFVDFGKGRHPDGRNFGDCFAYSLATTLGQPLPFKGEDFARTDVMRGIGSAAKA